MARFTKFAWFIVLLLVAPTCFATIFYVNASTGNDSNTCTQAQSTSTPKATLNGGKGCVGTADTETVYAGTYTENLNFPAGAGSGSYNTLTVNGSDVVTIIGALTLNSHTKLIGNCGAAPVAAGSCGFTMTGVTPTTASCITLPDTTTDVFITSNVLYSCGSAGSPTIIQGQGTNGISFVYITGNTMYYGCGTAGAPNNCTAIGFNGNHVLIQNNDFAHFGLVVETYAQHVVIRNNSFHDVLESECGSFSGNCHMDMIYAERSNTVAAYLVQYQLWEGNTATNIVGVDGKGLWTAADNPSGCGTSCFNVIGRFNAFAHFGSGPAAQTSGFLNVKYYNNSWIDADHASLGSPASTSYRDDSSSGGAEINNLFYYPQSVPTSWGWYAYSLNASGDETGFTAGANLAYCSINPCGQQTLRNGGTIHLFAADTPVISSNILASTDPLVNYSGGNYHLATGSPAIAAGTYLTTVASGDSGSGTSLVVTDAGFFQDGLGLNAAGVQADCISVTTVSNHVCITAVNYSTNTLTITPAISRSNADHIWLYSKSDGTVVLTGTAPNIGALGQSGGGGQASSPSCSPATSTYSGIPVIVTCSNPNSGTTIICYTVNGTTPVTNNLGTGCTTGIAYSSLINISTTETLQAVAGTSVLSDSASVSYTYTIVGSTLNSGNWTGSFIQ